MLNLYPQQTHTLVHAPFHRYTAACRRFLVGNIIKDTLIAKYPHRQNLKHRFPMNKNHLVIHTCADPPFCFLVKHVETVLRLNIPMAAFKKLRKIKGIGPRVDIMFSFFRELILLNLSSILCCNWLRDANFKHISWRARRWSSWNSLVKYNQRVFWNPQTIPSCVCRIRWRQHKMQNIKFSHELFWCSSHAAHVDPRWRTAY